MTIIKSLVAFGFFYFCAGILSTIIDRPFYEAVAIVALSVASVAVTGDD